MTEKQELKAAAMELSMRYASITLKILELAGEKYPGSAKRPFRSAEEMKEAEAERFASLSSLEQTAKYFMDYLQRP